MHLVRKEKTAVLSAFIDSESSTRTAIVGFTTTLCCPNHFQLKSKTTKMNTAIKRRLARIHLKFGDVSLSFQYNKAETEIGMRIRSTNWAKLNCKRDGIFIVNQLCLTKVNEKGTCQTCTF